MKIVVTLCIIVILFLLFTFALMGAARDEESESDCEWAKVYVSIAVKPCKARTGIFAKLVPTEKVMLGGFMNNSHHTG